MRLLLSASLLLIASRCSLAQLGATQQECATRYGIPVREALAESALLYFEQEKMDYIAHFHQGHCDVLSIFSANSMMGLPEDIGFEKAVQMLDSEGGGCAWKRVGRFTINGVWNSSDGKSFAIYDTMRHKLVIMTRDAYKREKEAVALSRSEVKATEVQKQP